MVNKIKPSVFLSHSRKDSFFVKRIEEDLRFCQIEPWLDVYEIRHGKSWLDEIFNLGIPTCHSVFVYLTENSIESEAVKKEIDASLVQKLEDKHVGFLPYVSDDSIRSKIRTDLKALQCVSFNNENYTNVFPQFVSAIWQNFLEYQINNAIKDEKNKRLELQLELQEINHRLSDSVFSQAEESDFSFIYERTNKYYELKDKDITYPIKINLLSFIHQLEEFRLRFLPYINNMIREKLITRNLFSKNARIMICNINLIEKLTIYGLIGRERVVDSSPVPLYMRHEMQYVTTRYRNEYVLTNKFHRFKYWMDYHIKAIEPIFIEE